MTIENFIQRDSAGERLASALLADSLLAMAAHLNHALRIMAVATESMESFAEEFER